MRLIDADALIDICKEVISKEWNKKAQPCSWAHAYAEFIDNIEDMPTVNRWHDLRKNPDDLPKPMDDSIHYECVHENHIYDAFYPSYQFDEDTKSFGYWNSLYNVANEDCAFTTIDDMEYEKIIAWREIEPFEEEE